MPAFKNLTGFVFGKLTVVKMEKIGKLNHCFCKCECGKSKWILSGNLSRKVKSTKSCGCVHNAGIGKENPNYRHGQGSKINGKYGTKVHRIWRGMLYRCYGEFGADYKDYGGRGIKVCDSWLVFKNFWRDMGDAPKGLTLDRINNDEDYSKENCRWANQTTQTRNARSNVMNFYFGDLLCISEASQKFCIHYNTLRARLAAGEDPESAATRPLYQKRLAIGG